MFEWLEARAARSGGMRNSFHSAFRGAIAQDRDQPEDLSEKDGNRYFYAWQAFLSAARGRRSGPREIQTSPIAPQRILTPEQARP